MGRLIDKILIFLLTLCLMNQMLSGNAMILVPYISIAIVAANYYLLTRERTDLSMKPEGVKEQISFALTNLGALLIVLFPQLSIAVPNLLYDITASRNYIA